MSNLIQNVIDSQEKHNLREFAFSLRQSAKRYLLRNDILIAFYKYCDTNEDNKDLYRDSVLARLIYSTQEIILDKENIYLVIRPKIATQEAYRLLDDMTVECISIDELLNLRDKLVDSSSSQDEELLKIDFQPFYDSSISLPSAKKIGNGVDYLNRYLSNKLFDDNCGTWQESLFNFLRLHKYKGQQLLINERIKSKSQLSEKVKRVIDLLEKYPNRTSYENFRFELRSFGFEPGWGNTAQRARETLELLNQLIDSADHEILEKFMSRIPLIFNVLVTSPHGWFGQEGVLGRPDTGGQVVYVLDQVKELEKQIEENAKLGGLDVIGKIEPKIIVLTRLIPNSEDTNCNQRLEKIYGSDNCWILRVPFRESQPEITQNWISRFEIHPYLESFATDSERELLAEFEGKPDLIIGNYTDGNLVAFLLSRRLNVTQCVIAHALEKSKYDKSDLNWQDLEQQYHFSLQFTADLIAMNAANFVVSSTYQEIIGTEHTPGQYESYQSFTMPKLYHVVSGIDLTNPKFNVVPPGVNENVYFPYTKIEDRLLDNRERLEDLLFTLEDSTQVFGKLSDISKRPIFSMARLDKIKNLTGLAECFGKSKQLQEQCNLILVAGKLRTEDSTDSEEINEIEKLYQIIDKYSLQGKIRWLGVRLSKSDSGEIYRIIGDRQGIFVQPALFEAFGLTVLEAMISGLPTFATRFGGPLEIIQDKVNGFYINPTNHQEMAQTILEFLSKCDFNPSTWNEFSQKGIERVYENYTWKIHSNRLLSLAKTYSLYNYASGDNREDMLRYVESLFHLLYKPRAKALLEEHTTSVS
ncbi:sucrose synthase [Rivularia sp. PCC 7116]|uniref:sucrose synthase n=1 Tax=Rivularia sp. PCC 7116 TaxID=373994 RepID=UPI00029F11D3|nr:sucrose synthase [Rivularia sp. PCC 7116]AFY58552.1 sucrose synthase [Rivularia sp. PCC 7116]